ncbi:MAG: hypothetical protein KZQ99_22135 [Candidatus Thiodiazotropha sp. (ex Dulcina madagascariensis)]|nr:hypothetical protein [Candidatus Thiodiazotropha sp. (ex Epidulcina cf. delphinae)]MCU7937521.1 hypothetical protein [Candidatus Thiodiazotropha sp. (ex Dulcina madagascariensis)]
MSIFFPPADEPAVIRGRFEKRLGLPAPREERMAPGRFTGRLSRPWRR